MPPSAIFSSVNRAIAPGRASPPAIRRSRYSIVIGCGNFGAPPHDPFRVSNVRSEPVQDALEDRRRRRLGGHVAALPLDQRLDHALGRRPRPRRAPSRQARSDALEHLAERRHAVARLVRVVGAAVERPAVGREEDRHRPPAAAGHRLDGAHVELVEVGALLAVDLDRDEVLVEVVRRGAVLERLALHHVAPVAGRV